MSILYQLEKKFGRYAIPNLTYILIVGQVFAFVLINLYPDYAPAFSLRGRLILEGQWWRIVTFLFQPISMDLLWAAFEWYIFYLYGTALERLWGSFRYMIYVLIAYASTIALSFVFPDFPMTNGYLYTSLFLAFAYLFPDFQLLLFFILPVKVKWLGIIAWIGIIGSVLLGSLPTKILTIASVTNFLIFFGDDLLHIIRRKMGGRGASIPEKQTSKGPYHVCAVCGRNEKKNPEMEIRYCSKCIPSTCYCEDHIKHHVHVT